MIEQGKLTFRVAPHIVEDLGLNLYTTLPRVLVEFVANAYDADSAAARIVLDKRRIEHARDILKAEWELEKTRAEAVGNEIPRLAAMCLPDDVTITIEDAGIGMTREDLQDKFLVAGRRRRGRDNSNSISTGGRVLMGRKGLGKLAGFGVAKTVTLTSRAKGSDYGTRIVLDFDNVLRVSDTNEIPILEQQLYKSDLPNEGTTIVLSRLLYEPMKARLTTIENEIADHFAQIDPADFVVELNGARIAPAKRVFVYAWPEPTVPIDQLIPCSYKTDDGREFTFQYRIRFLEDRQALGARDRGIRVYAHKRLAAAPELLDADTNMHGFRMTDYLDGVVHADFIDDQPEDYIATDRQALRWESPLLAPMKAILSQAVKDACYSRQSARDKEKQDEVRNDPFTNTEIQKAELSKKEEEAAFRIAGAISSLHKQGLKDEGYQTRFTQVMQGFSQGEILSTLAGLAAQDRPDFDRLITEITRLTASELDGFYKFVRGRLHGIKALRKIVTSVDFKKKDDEGQLHRLFNECPWLIDATFFEFLTSNQTERTLFRELERALQIGRHVPDEYDSKTDDERKPGGRNQRPDLVFLLGNSDLNRLVIVELKAPNTPLYGEHYRQLQKYVRHANQWFNDRGHKSVIVEGILIGSVADLKSKADDVEWLREEMRKSGNRGECRVQSIDMVLEQTEKVHWGILERDKAKDSSSSEQLANATGDCPT